MTAKLMWQRQLNYLLAAVAAAVFLWGLWPSIEARLLPVLSSIKIMDPISRVDERLLFRFEYDKYRPCKLTSVQATVSGHWVSFFSVPGTGVGLKISRPVGHNVSSVWSLTADSLDFDDVEITFSHRCPLLWWGDTVFVNEPWSIQTRVYP